FQAHLLNRGMRGPGGRPSSLLLLLRSRPGQNSIQAVIVFVACVLVERARLVPRDYGGPRPRPCRGIADGEPVVDPIIGDPRPPFNESHILCSAFKRCLIAKVCRFDHESVPFPVSARISTPLADIGLETRTAVQRNDSRL